MEEKIIVRLMTDTKTDTWWYEEKFGKSWVEIPNTRKACEGNAVTNLREYIRDRKIDYYKSYTKQVGEEKELKISF